MSMKGTSFCSKPWESPLSQIAGTSRIDRVEVSRTRFIDQTAELQANPEAFIPIRISYEMTLSASEAVDGMPIFAVRVRAQGKGVRVATDS